MQNLKKAIISCLPGSEHNICISNCIYSPMVISMGPGTHSVRWFGAPNIKNVSLPGIDISKFNGGVPLKSVVEQISRFSGKLGVVLHGGKFGRELSAAAQYPVFIPEVPAESISYIDSIQNIACPVITPKRICIDYENGARTRSQLSPHTLSEILSETNPKAFFSTTHTCFYATIQTEYGFRFILFDTAETIARKCQMARALDKTPILYYSELKALPRQYV